MKDLLTYIAQNLVEHPQAVDVQETETDGNVVLELRVDPSDMGKVIGRQGRIAKEIRTLMRSVAQRQGKKGAAPPPPNAPPPSAPHFLPTKKRRAGTHPARRLKGHGETRFATTARRPFSQSYTQGERVSKLSP